MQSSVKLQPQVKKTKLDQYQSGPQEGLVPFYYPQLYGHRWWLECTPAGPSAVDTISPLCIRDRVLKKRKREVAEEVLSKNQRPKMHVSKLPVSTH